MNQLPKKSTDVLKSRKFMTLIVTALIVFLNGTFSLAIGDDIIELLVYLAGLAIGGYALQDVVLAWRSSVGQDVEKLISDAIELAIQGMKDLPKE